MGIFRSEEMCLKKIRIPRENAVEILTALGSLDDSIEFIDLTKDEVEGKKNFAMMIRRCEEIEKKICTIERYCEDYIQKCNNYSTYQDFLFDLSNDQIKRDRVHGSTYFDLVEAEVMEEEKKLIELIDTQSEITEHLERLIEKKYVLLKSSQMLPNDWVQLQNPMLEEGIVSSSLHFIGGVIKADEELKMKRMIFRAARGHVISTFWDFELTEEEYCLTSNAHTRRETLSSSPKTAEVSESQQIIGRDRKKIFAVVFYRGEENYLLTKILQICDIFNANRYSLPNSAEIHHVLDNIEKDINSQKHLKLRTELNIRDFVEKILYPPDTRSKPRKYALYHLFFKQEKFVFHTLNKCILRDTFIDGEVWIPTKDVENVQKTLKDLFYDNELMLTANLYDPHFEETLKINPPTYIHSNEFLWAFQEIVDTYGIPRYQEINPAYFNIVTFPFLFGIMFGDIGHGFLLLLLGIYLCLFSSQIKSKGNSFLKTALKARYLLLLMGFFAFYSGWIYNDFFSIPLEFGSCYKKINSQSGIAVKEDPKCVYPFGLDPKWYFSKNQLSYFNSLKMKLSVIVGVSHMMLGIFLQGRNSLYFGMYSDFLFKFLPRCIFMGILFGYLDVMIFIKWSVDWTGKKKYAPNLISQLMNIFLKFGSVSDMPLWGRQLEKGGYEQEWFNFGVLICSLVCIPIMLVPRAVIEYQKLKRKQDKDIHVLPDDVDNLNELEINFTDDRIMPEKVQYTFSEIFVHHSIETIEFLLGGISNTASYLRLWALSLAHSQLSKVFFQKTILASMRSGNILLTASLIIFGYFAFASITFFVLMCMDTIECFLHTLRLHWYLLTIKHFMIGWSFKINFIKPVDINFSRFVLKVSLKIRRSEAFLQ